MAAAVEVEPVQQPEPLVWTSAVIPVLQRLDDVVEGGFGMGRMCHGMAQDLRAIHKELTRAAIADGAEYQRLYLTARGTISDLEEHKRTRLLAVSRADVLALARKLQITATELEG